MINILENFKKVFDFIQVLDVHAMNNIVFVF